MSRFRPLCLAGVLLCAVIPACQGAKDPLARIRVLDNPWLQAPSRPALLAERLHNPMSPRLAGGKLILAESGAGDVSAIENGKANPLIRGFVKARYEGYDISAEGVTIDPASGLWIVAAAEGPGRVQLFDPSTFPTDARRGRDVPLEGAVEDNPFATVLAAGGRILVVSGGTKTAYQGRFDPTGGPNPVRPAFEVKTGLIGLAVDPRSGDVFGAVFGDVPGSGEVVRWNAAQEPVALETVASGFTNPIDVAFTREGVLLALEFGGFDGKRQGKVSIVATDGSRSVTPFITGLSHPSGLSIGPDDTLYITEFGDSMNAKEGDLISLKLVHAGQR
jgi:hypothetical protein